jgi:16S rRNA (uracil1498-N3)-methyltransferase
MKLHRFIGLFDLRQKEIEIRDPQLIHQMIKVLRFKNGHRLILGDGRSRESLGEIKKISPGVITVTLEKVTEDKEKKVPRISLYCALLKRENFEWVAQKATEIGISELIPLRTARVIKQNINEERIRKIIREAAEQSGRITTPELLPSRTLSEALEHSRGSEERWFFDEAGSSLKVLGYSCKEIGSFSLFVGPEGGWTEIEKERARATGFKIISLGSHTLRAETAAIIGSYLAVACSRRGI